MDSAKISQIADIMRDHGLSRVRVEEPDGSAVELECGGVAPAPAAPVTPAPAPSAPALAACSSMADAPPFWAESAWIRPW